nr:hypothetical protein [Lachnospiraceae bacterium]
ETYRTGGDEFLAIIYGDDPEEAYQSVVKDLNIRIKEYNDSNNKAVKLSFAYGVAECRWYLVSVFYKIQATTYILHIGIDKCRKELL